MLRTLRSRLILSHILPVLVIVPLMGIALVYFLETRVLLPSLVKELEGEALLAAELASEQPDLWINGDRAQAAMTQLKSDVSARVMLLNADGTLLASSDPVDGARLGQRLELPYLDEVLAGKMSTHAQYSQRLQGEIADVLAPIHGADGKIVGVVRLSYPLSDVNARFLQLRYLIVGIAVIGLLLGVLVGWLLAVDLGRPLMQVTEAVLRLAMGRELQPLAEQGPEEVTRLARAYNILVDRLLAVEQSRRQLLGNLVHELGRSLGAIHSAVQALQLGADRDLVLRAELLAGIEAHMGHLKRLLDDLASFYEQVSGRFALSVRSVNLGEWLPQVISPWGAAAREQGLTWEVSLADDLPSLEVDPDRLGQVLGNLLSNGIKYTPPGGKLVLTAGVDAVEVWIQVSDTGPGISPEDQERIFTPFFRGSTNGRFPQGMGLGLGIARDLILAHGGRLVLDSALGEGSRFTIWLPRS
jgi:two-component system sensor histidine kinase BaeS